MRITSPVKLLWGLSEFIHAKYLEALLAQDKQYKNVDFYYYEAEWQKIRKWLELEHSALLPEDTPGSSTLIPRVT